MWYNLCMLKIKLKKVIILVLGITLFTTLSGFKSEEFTIDNFDNYEKEFETEEMDVCFNISAKTYMPYTAITKKGSPQYKYIHEKMTVDETTGMLYDEEGFIGAALASDFGKIGSRYYFTLDSGIVLPIVKVDAKPDMYTDGCAALSGHIIEFVIDTKKAGSYFGVGPSGLVNYGNFNNDSRFEGVIVKIEKVLDEKIDSGITYVEHEIEVNLKNEDVDTELSMFAGY